VGGVTVHVIERVAEDDRWMFACTCGVLLSANAHRAFELFDEHLAEDVTPDPLDTLALIEAKQRHPSRRGLA